MFKIDKKDQPAVNVFNGVERRTLACGKDVLMARFEYKKGSTVPPHKHNYEQATTLLKGEQEIIIKNEKTQKEFKVKTGDSYIVPAFFIHEQKSLKDTVTIDVWCLAP